MHSTESSQDISHQVHHRETTPVNPQNPTFDSPPMTTPPKMEGLLSQSRPESPRIKSLKEVTTNMPKMTQATSTGAVSQRGSIVISSNDPPTADSPDLARSKSHHKSRFHVHVPHVHMPHFFKHHSHKSDTNKSEYWPRTLSVAVGAPKAQPTGISPSVSSKLRQEIKAPDHDTLQPPIVAEASSSYFPPAASSTGVATTSSTSSIHSSPVSIPIPKPVPDLDGVGEILPRDTSLVPSAKESIRTAASSGSSNASTVDTDGTGIGSTSTSVTSYDSASSSPMNQKPHHDHAGPPSTFQAAMGRGLNANEVVPSSSLNPLPSDTTDPLVEVSLPEASSLPDINETEVALPEPQSFFPGSASKEIPPGEDPLKKWSFSFISSNKSKLDLKTKRSPKSGTANTSHTSTPSPRSLIIPLTAVAKTAKSTDEKSSPTLETTPTAKLKGHDATKPSSMRGRVRDMNVHGPTLWYRMSQPHTDQDVAEFLLGVDLKEENARRKQENAEKHKSWAQKNRIEKEEAKNAKLMERIRKREEKEAREEMLRIQDEARVGSSAASSRDTNPENPELERVETVTQKFVVVEEEQGVKITREDKVEVTSGPVSTTIIHEGGTERESKLVIVEELQGVSDEVRDDERKVTVTDLTDHMKLVGVFPVSASKASPDAPPLPTANANLPPETRALVTALKSELFGLQRAHKSQVLSHAHALTAHKKVESEHSKLQTTFNQKQAVCADLQRQLNELEGELKAAQENLLGKQKTTQETWGLMEEKKVELEKVVSESGLRDVSEPVGLGLVDEVEKDLA